VSVSAKKDIGKCCFGPTGLGPKRPTEEPDKAKGQLLGDGLHNTQQAQVHLGQWEEEEEEESSEPEPAALPLPLSPAGDGDGDGGSLPSHQPRQAGAGARRVFWLIIYIQSIETHLAPGSLRSSHCFSQIYTSYRSYTRDKDKGAPGSQLPAPRAKVKGQRGRTA
jgi:hypothetical protein